MPVISSSDTFEEHWDKDFFDEAIIVIGGNLMERERVFKDLSGLNIPFRM